MFNSGAQCVFSPKTGNQAQLEEVILSQAQPLSVARIGVPFIPTQISELLEVHKLWDLKAIGIKQEQLTSDYFTLDQYDHTVTYENAKYEIELPW